MLNKISQCIAEETKNLPTLSGAKVSSVNTDGTINVYFPPDDTKIFTNISNQTPFNLQVGDSVELLLKDGSYNNCWIVAKHQDTFTGKFSNSEDIENLVSTTEIDPVFASSPAYLITEADISKWDRATSVFPSSTVPKMDGTATVGTETSYARGDHIHPTDTTRQAKITASGILKGDGDGTVTSAVAGTDYAEASHTHNASAIVSGTLDWDVLPTARIYDATASRTANTVLAAPNGSAGPASFRTLVAADIPSLNYVPKVTSTDNAVVRFNGTGGAIQNSGVTIDDNNVLLAPAIGTSTNTYIEFPDGGGFRTTGSTQTGYLKITLPQSWTDTMMSFKVQMYQYNQNTSCEFTIGGYNYSSGSGTWTNRPFAYSIGKSDVQTYSNLTVRLGHDGTKCAIYIGEANTSWKYMQVQVHDVIVGYNNYEYDKWATGWSVGFTTTLGTITATIENPCVSHYATTAGTATSATSATSATTATTASASGALNFVHTNELLLGNTNSQTRVWINYRRVSGGATSGNTAITEYHFGNGNAGTTGVTLYAANFSGVAAKATAANVTTTANALAVYSDTTGTFSGKASGNGALYATAANGAWSVGTLPAAQGGTGKTTWTQYGVLYASATNALANTAAGTAGYLLQSNGTAAPSWRTVVDTTTAKTAMNNDTGIPTGRKVLHGIEYMINRTTAVNVADTAGYATYMARGIALGTSVPSTTPANGCLFGVYASS